MTKNTSESLEAQDDSAQGQRSVERPAVAKGRQGQLIRAAHLFEQMLDLVEPHSTPAAVPAAALLNLLRQCEEAAAPEGDISVPMLIALPGLPMLTPAWWQSAAGWDVVRLPENAAADGSLPQAEQLAVMRDARAAAGERLLTVISTSDASGDLPAPLRPRALLHCHPWQAFLAVSTSVASLEAFCSAILTLLDRHPDLPLYQVQPEDLTNPAACQKALLRLADEAAPAAPADRAQPTRWVQNDYIGGAPAYDALCARLGYEPTRMAELPDAPMPRASITAPVAAAHSDNAPKSVVSWFIERTMALPSGPLLAARMRALIPVLDGCLTAPAFPEAIDKAAGQLHPTDAALLRLLAGAHFQRREDPLQSMTLITDALEGAAPDLPGLHQAGALLYLELNRPLQALEALTGPLTIQGAAGERGAGELRKAIFKDSAIDAAQHGQALLLAALAKEPVLPTADGRKRIMIEIGTTRETVPGQGSTRQLALLCADRGIDFVTVDMDPANSRRAARLFRRLGLPFRAITSKGEDYLAAFDGVIDYVFLDAYDFDHGKHSDLRQSRYEQFLGGRINDADCHQMHLDCAHSLTSKLSPDGLICFDDTWTDEDGAWTAKGATAMPFLLENGFSVIEARNHAALLRRID